MSVRFGIGFDMRNPAEWRKPWAEHYRDTLELIAWSETLGFEQVCIAEHHGDDAGYCPSPLVVMATLAGMTKTMRLGTGIALPAIPTLAMSFVGLACGGFLVRRRKPAGGPRLSSLS